MENATKILPGIRRLSADEAAQVDLGPLQQLVGTWQNAPVNPRLIAQGWNVIAVPGRDGFVLEVIPYTETLTFSPVVMAGNRGPFDKGAEVTQEITGLMYEQVITSACPAGSPCTDRGFGFGTEIHAERGLFLNVGEPNGNFTIARLASVPHGNALLALGHFTVLDNPGTDFIQPASSLPTMLNGDPLPSTLLGYTDPYSLQQFPNIFDQADPNSFLTAVLKASTNPITHMTTLHFATNNPDATGGILNIPFIQSNVNATRMNAIFWIEELQNAPGLQLQYTQTVNLVFPPTDNPTQLIAWPHISVNTLVKANA